MPYKLKDEITPEQVAAIEGYAPTDNGVGFTRELPCGTIVLIDYDGKYIGGLARRIYIGFRDKEQFIAGGQETQRLLDLGIIEECAADTSLDYGKDVQSEEEERKA